MSTAKLNTTKLNANRLNNGASYPYSFNQEMDRLQDAKPVMKVEYISPADVTTNISAYYLSGATVEQLKDRAPDEISAGNFDIVLSNQDDTFSEFVATSLLYNAQYIGARIKISEGFILPDGTEVYEPQMVGYIDELVVDGKTSYVTFRCRDLLKMLMDRKLNGVQPDESPTAGSNVGNGQFQNLATKPFLTINDSWTLTCTLAGGDGVGTFSVVGSSSGNIGTATSGSLFTSSTYGLRFTMSAGSTAWVVGDTFTFSTHQYPQWDGVNPAKIIWSILTGYNWNTDTAENWSSLVFALDHTQSDANTQIDYASFVTASANFDSFGIFSLKGYVPRDTAGVSFLQDLLLLFLGSIYTSGDGRITLKTYAPSFDVVESREFSDVKKVRELGYDKSIDEVINRVTVNYKSVDSWEWSDQAIVYTGIFSESDTDSIADYGEIASSFSSIWFSSDGQHVQDFADKIVTRYADPPLNIDLVTGVDALKTFIGDTVLVTDTKYNFSQLAGEVVSLTKNLDQNPINIQMRVRQDPTLNVRTGFWGSTIDEHDGLSPQASNFDSATAGDKRFSYLGDETTTADPDYRMF